MAGKYHGTSVFFHQFEHGADRAIEGLIDKLNGISQAETIHLRMLFMCGIDPMPVMVADAVRSGEAREENIPLVALHQPAK